MPYNGNGHARGIRHPKAKVNEDQVRAIRASSLTYEKLAKKYQLSLTNIWRIKNRITWKHVE